MVSGMIVAAAIGAGADAFAADRVWPAQVHTVGIPASDGTSQPAIWYAPAESQAKPLLVGLHTWSNGYSSATFEGDYADWAIAHGWAFVHPHFRGPNRTPQAMGSDRAVQDVVEAVAWARGQTKVDPNRIYLVGVSGGGHMALLMAGRHPEIWAGVSAWCGISDIEQWHAEHVTGRSLGGGFVRIEPENARDIEQALGGAPETDPARHADAWSRSPLRWLHAAAGVPLDINAGINDGRGGSVSFLHSLRAFDAVVPPADRLGETASESFYAARLLPSGWPAAGPDPLYGDHQPLFRKTSGNTRITIFEGGHQILPRAALEWLSRQRKKQPAVW